MRLQCGRPLAASSLSFFGCGLLPIQPAKLQWRCFPMPTCIPLGDQHGLECWCLRPQLSGPPEAPGPGTGACAPVLPQASLSLQPWALQDSAAASGNLCWTLQFSLCGHFSAFQVSTRQPWPPQPTLILSSVPLPLRGPLLTGVLWDVMQPGVRGALGHQLGPLHCS